MSVSRMSQVTLPLSTIAFTLAASGGPSSRTRIPVAFSKGANITSRIAVVRDPPQPTTTSSPLSARAGLTCRNGDASASDAPVPPRMMERLDDPVRTVMVSFLLDDRVAGQAGSRTASSRAHPTRTVIPGSGLNDAARFACFTAISGPPSRRSIRREMSPT